MKQVNLSQVKPGDFFTLTPHEQPTENQVWVMDGYDRVTRLYEAHKFTDVHHDLASGRKDRKVYIEFIF